MVLQDNEGELRGQQTYRAEGDSGGGQADQPSVAGMGLVDGVRKVIAELVEDGLDPGVVLLGDKVADEAF